MIVAITVSTNYADLLPIVYESNHQYLKHWVFVTDKHDSATINFLSNKSNITILYWDFKNNGRVFDKGGAIQHAQKYVYEKYPNCWYLILDSDICLPPSTSLLTGEYLPNLNPEAIYGVKERYDFKSLNDFIANKNYSLPYQAGIVYGFFQLFKAPHFYTSSNDASYCDAEFSMLFKKRIIIQNFICAHLGESNIHWKGNRKPGSDFKQ